MMNAKMFRSLMVLAQAGLTPLVVLTIIIDLSTNPANAALWIMRFIKESKEWEDTK